jgi:hypothetical protein
LVRSLHTSTNQRKDTIIQNALIVDDANSDFRLNVIGEQNVEMAIRDITRCLYESVISNSENAGIIIDTADRVHWYDEIIPGRAGLRQDHE